MNDLIEYVKLLLGVTKFNNTTASDIDDLIGWTIKHQWRYFLAQYYISDGGSLYQQGHKSNAILHKRATLKRSLHNPFDGDDVAMSYYKLPSDLIFTVSIELNKTLLSYRTFYSNLYGSMLNGAEGLEIFNPSTYLNVYNGGLDFANTWMPIVKYGVEFVVSPITLEELYIEYVSNDPDYIVKSEDLLKSCFIYFVADKLIGQLGKDLNPTTIALFQTNKNALLNDLINRMK